MLIPESRRVSLEVLSGIISKFQFNFVLITGELSYILMPDLIIGRRGTCRPHGFGIVATECEITELEGIMIVY